MNLNRIEDFHQYPDANGHFGRYGGRFVAETLIGPLQELAAAYDAARVDPAFIAEFEKDLKHYVGRPSPIYEAQRLSKEVGGARILLKREDLNNTIGQALLASRMGKTRIIAETGAGQHGVASATVAARLGLECVVYMGAEDTRRQALDRLVQNATVIGANAVISMRFDSSEIAGTMTEMRVRHVPIVDEDGNLTAIVSIGDIVKHRLNELQSERDALREYITN